MPKHLKRGVDAGDATGSYDRKRSKSNPAIGTIPYDGNADEDHILSDEAISRKNFQPGAELLAALFNQCTTLNPKYGRVQEATALYNEYPQIRDALKKACEERNFRSIRTLDFIHAFMKFDSPNDSRRAVGTALDRYQDNLRLYAEGDVNLKAWIPTSDSYAHINLPSKSSDFPDLLLHELGEWSQDGGVMAQTVPMVFSPEHHTFVFNASGTGKTRLLLDGLVRKWGFYFACATDLQSPHGSFDLTFAIKLLSRSKRFCNTVSLGNADPTDIIKNRDITEQSLLKVWLVRLLVFERFLSLVPRTMPVDEAKRRWLFLQLFPSKLVQSDVFSVVSRSLSGAEITFMKAMITETFINIKQRLPCDEHLFAVFDEAQYATKTYNEAFLSEDFTEHRPVLAEIIAVWENLGHDMTLVVSGTSPFTNVRRNSRSSPIGSPGGWQLFTSTGEFSARESQEKYIMRYIWPSVKVKEDLAHRDQSILDRAWRWFRGRHRFTSSYITLLLCFGLRSAHRLLNMPFTQATNYTPIDGAGFVDHEPELKATVKDRVKTLSQIKANVLNDDGLEYFKKDAFDTLLRSVFRSHGIVSTDNRDELVSLGFAHICGPPIAGRNDVRMDEPIMLMALATWFNSLPGTVNSAPQPKSYISMISRHPNANDVMACYLLNAFSGETRLDKFIKFAGPKPSWASESAELVTIVGKDNTGTRTTCVITPTSGYSPSFGIQPTTSTETSRWLENPDGVPFCFPDENFGPDIIFLIKVGERRIWVCVQTMGRLKKRRSSTRPPAVQREAFSSEIRSNLIPPDLMAYAFEKDDERRRSKRRKTMNPDLFLRLIASYPKPPKATSLREHAAEYPYPLGLIDMTGFVNAMSAIFPHFNDDLTK
ncbi:hypothetical protein BD410DRAFT_523108 [Rickenella mellea]|uniref:Uncharacterized protein n=1 Tax=Rickenella mellea TaxID=50990 RepID=A0A4Y7QHE4_9AGAM|nr:hypothetical protein BD410DRAFT_523108 [Rickenella mellea]